jgi:glycosyltransferase involved in cell wall biosynthesis
MKVLQVIDKLNIGGAERVFVDMASILSDADLTVEVLLFDNTGKLTGELNSNIVVHNLDRKNKYSISKLYHTNKLCSGFDIVHVHMRHCYFYIRLAKLLFGGKYKIILHDHYGDIEINRQVPFRLKGVFKPDYYIGVSSSLTEWAKRYLGTKHVFLLRNTIVPSGQVQYNSQYQNKAFVISNIRKTKNIGFAIDLAKKMGWGLDIYGNKNDKEYYQHLLQQINGYDKIKIVDGVSDFSDHYNNYSLAIHCATSETGPLVLLEYMAYGIPFISYRTGEVASTVAEDLPLHFIDSFETNKWQQQIDSILSGNCSNKLKETFNKHFSVDKYRNECLSIYQSVHYS